MALLTLLAKLGTGVFIAYRLSSGGTFTLRGIAAYGAAIAGVLAGVDGFSLAYQEEHRIRYGRVISGVVVEKLSSSGDEGSRRIGPRGGRNQERTLPIVTINGFRLHDVLARIITTGSPQAWVIAYRFPCDAPRGCTARDFVSEAQWDRLRVGQPVYVRQGAGERFTARLDANPQWQVAAGLAGISGVLLVAASMLAGHVPFRRSPGWVRTPAVVLAVEPLTTGDDPRWRVRFAYFDRNDVPQESADEVRSAGWQVGDSCVAEFRPARPGLAMLRRA